MHDGRKLALNAAVMLGVLLAAATHPVSGGKVLVISPTWLGYPSALSVIAAADGSVVGDDMSSNVAVAFSEDPSFVGRLYRSGALLIWGANFLGGCRSNF